MLGDDYEQVEAAVLRAREVFAGRAVWNVNSTARGGGVAEMLRSLLAYTRGAGIDARWVVIRPDDPGFFRVTKRLHNNLHGSPGDGGPLGSEERSTYERGLESSAEQLRSIARPGDVAILHDPQTVGLAGPMREAGSHVVWRCHIGIDEPNRLARRAWDLLRPYAERAEAYVFSRRQYAWEGLSGDRLRVIPPSIDALSPKNQDLAPSVVGAILETIGLTANTSGAAPTFARLDGTPARVDRRAELDQDAPLPPSAPVVAQVSRWDSLKDPIGLLECFAEHCHADDLHLVLGGPSVQAVADDPEGAEVLAEVRDRRAALPGRLRARVHLASLPMDDTDENAAMVNALQRRAEVVVQKSIAEGFGLTVAEAMWKAKPVVAGRLGGIQDQIVDGESGILIDDPRNLEAFGKAIEALISDPDRARRLGEAARDRVRHQFLATRHLVQYVDLLETLVR